MRLNFMKYLSHIDPMWSLIALLSCRLVLSEVLSRRQMQQFPPDWQLAEQCNNVAEEAGHNFLFNCAVWHYGCLYVARAVVTEKTDFVFFLIQN